MEAHDKDKPLIAQVSFQKIHHKTIDSTHKDALRRLVELKNSYTCIYADTQTNGIGRGANTWSDSPGKNLLITWVFPLQNLQDLSNLGQLLAFSMIQVLKNYGFSPLFKWPNDLLLNEKKVCGILVDCKDNQAVASIGLNINLDTEYLENLLFPATSLFQEAGKTFSISKVREDVIQRFTKDLTVFYTKGFSPFYQEFSSYLAYVGKLARVGPHQGVIKALHTDGRLILEKNGKDIFCLSHSLELI